MSKNALDILKNDPMVAMLWETVQKAKAAISQAEKPNWATNRMFSFTANNMAKEDLCSVTNVLKLRDMYSFLIQKEAHNADANKELGIDESEGSWLNFPITDWKADIKTRVDQLQLQKKKDLLTKQEAKLNSLLTVEQRRAIEIAALAAEMGVSMPESK